MKSDQHKKNNTVSAEVVDKVIRKNAIMKLAVMGVFIAAIIAFQSIAWFTMNREVSGNGMQMTASDLPFEIATKGKIIRNEDVLKKADSFYIKGDETNIDNTTYYKTTGNKEQIALMFDTENSDNNNDIGPGDSGVLELYIIPKQDGNLKVRIDLNVVGYIETDVYVQDVDDNGNPKTDENGNPIYKMKSVNVSENGTTVTKTENVTEKKVIAISNLSSGMCTLTDNQIENLTKAEKYIKGHIMFFEKKSEDTSYSYKNPLIDRTLLYNKNDVQEGKAYSVPIYWIWPNTFGQIALKTESSLRSGIPVVADLTENQELEGTDKGKVLQYLKEHKEEIFAPIEIDKIINSPSDIGITNINLSSDELYGMEIDAMIDNADNELYFKELSNGYNIADFTIGSNIGYFLVEVTVQVSSENN